MAVLQGIKACLLGFSMAQKDLNIFEPHSFLFELGGKGMSQFMWSYFALTPRAWNKL
jgi:hypothetical protein